MGERAGVLSALAALALCVGSASGQSEPSFAEQAEGRSSSPQSSTTEGALFLLLPVGAQGVALGRAMTSFASQEAAFWNPAGLADLRESRFFLYRGDQFAGESTAISILLTREPIGTLGLSYQLLDIGDQDLRDAQGEVLGTVSVRSHLAILSFATSLLDRVDTGVNLKLVQTRVSCRGRCLDPGVTATTYAVDAGLQARPLERVPLRLGAMIAHLGPRLQVVNAEQADPLPTRIRLSGAYEVMGHFAPDREMGLWVSVELEDRWRSVGVPSLYLGTEFSAGRRDMVFVRAGYVLGEVDQTDGAALGMGFKFQRFDVGVAKSLATSQLGEEEPVHVTFGVVF